MGHKLPETALEIVVETGVKTMTETNPKPNQRLDPNIDRKPLRECPRCSNKTLMIGTATSTRARWECVYGWGIEVSGGGYVRTDSLGSRTPATREQLGEGGDCGYKEVTANAPVERGFMTGEGNVSNMTKGQLLQAIEHWDEASVAMIAEVSFLSKGQINGSLRRCLKASEPTLKVVGVKAVFPSGSTRLYSLTEQGSWWLAEARRLGYLEPKVELNGVAHDPESQSIIEETDVEATSPAPSG